MARAPHILIADDERADVELMQIVLQGEGVEEVTAVRDGAEALDYLNRRGNYSDRAPGNPDLIFLDLNLPKVSGLQVLGQMRAEQSLQAVPVVVFSSSLDERDRQESLVSGADDYAVKPINFEQFQAVIARMVEVHIKKTIRRCHATHHAKG
jgi:CheY-like chemotaxis protein